MDVNTFPCENTPCIRVCPMNPRSRLESGAVLTNEEKCIGCRTHAFTSVRLVTVVNPDNGKTMSCYLCMNDEVGPWCAKACTMQQAIKFICAQACCHGKRERYGQNHF